MSEPAHLLAWDALSPLRREALERERQMQRRAQRTGPGPASPGPDSASGPQSAPMGGRTAPAASGHSAGTTPPGAGEGKETPGALTPELQETLSQLLGALGSAGPDPSPGPSPGSSPSSQPSGPRREGAAPDSILSQLFSGAPRFGPAASSPPASRRGGLSRLIRGGFEGGETGELGDRLRNAVSSASKPLSDLLDSLSIDGETLLILRVMWVIFRERSDNKMLLLALGYLLL